MRYRLKRRGVDHGTAEPVPRETAWARSEPEILRGAVTPTRGSIRIINQLRKGASLVDLLPRKVRAAGVSQNTQDPLEMEKVHFTAKGRELYIKVNWLSTHPGDGSMRLRCSFGAEVLDDWLDDTVAARASEKLFENIFPETAAVTKNRPLIAAIRKRMGTPRFVQRILYSNAPGGGALFHHDFVPRQLGVCYAQLAGITGWFTLPKRNLARHIQEHTGKWKNTSQLLEYLDSDDPHRVIDLINHTPAFTRRLVADGWFFVVKPGDVVLLPSQDWNDVAWHSIFTLKRGDNLALSFGLSAKAN